MKIHLPLVVSMLLCTLFPIPAFATVFRVGDGGLVIGPSQTDGGVTELAPKPTPTSTAVIIVPREVTAAEVNDIGRRVATAMTAASIPVAVGPEESAKKLEGKIALANIPACVKKPKCLPLMGSLEVSVVVVVELGGLQTMAVAMEAISIADGKRLALQDFRFSKENLKSGPIAGFDKFAKELESSLKPAVVAVAKEPLVDTAEIRAKEARAKAEAKAKAEADAKAKAEAEQKLLAEKAEAEAKAHILAPVQPVPDGFVPPYRAPASASRSRFLTWTGVGVGVAGLGTFVPAIVFNLQYRADWERHKALNGVDRLGFDLAVKSGQENIRNSTICFIVGSVALATGITLVVLDNTGASPTGSVSVSFVPSGNGGALVGTF